MKVFSTDGSVLVEVKSLEANGNNIEFKGSIMGTMPAKGRITPAEARKIFKLIKGWRMWWLLLTFLLRR